MADRTVWGRDGQLYVLPSYSGPQPSLLDQLWGSVLGRFLHDQVFQPRETQSDILVRASIPMLYGESPVAGAYENLLTKYIEQPYQDALARNRNTPGYTAARQKAENEQVVHGVSTMDQAFPAFSDVWAGLHGLVRGEGLDGMNARQDARVRAIKQDEEDNPYSSLAAQTVGDLMTGSVGRSLGKAAAPVANAIGKIARPVRKYGKDINIPDPPEGTQPLIDRMAGLRDVTSDPPWRLAPSSQGSTSLLDAYDPTKQSASLWPTAGSFIDRNLYLPPNRHWGPNQPYARSR